MRQEEALNILKMGHTAFVTGNAGSGKTYLLNRFIDWLAACKVPYAVTAATGIAATHLSGRTLHSWSGLGVKKRLEERDLDALSQKKELYKRWNETAVLIVDEVSMLSADQIDALNIIGKVMRRGGKPFGGMTVVFSGDFFQLPPISRGDEKPSRFAYESDTWKAARPVFCYLESRHRHSGDEAFAQVLNEIRGGRVSEQSRALLNSRRTKPDAVPENITKLYTHNRDVDAENEEKLTALPGKEWRYEMHTKGGKYLVETLKRGCLAPEILRLKVGAEVMFVKNDPKQLYVNGTRGVVEDFKEGLPVVKVRSGRKILAEYTEWRIEEHGVVRARIEQIPLRLAWAITVHKSQGLTLDEAYMELADAFVPGQGYVALSRVRGLDGLYLGTLGDMALAVDEVVRRADGEFQERSHKARARLSKIPAPKVEKRHRAFIKCHNGTYKKNVKPRRADAAAPTRISSHRQTFELLKERKSIKDIAAERGITQETVLNHIEKLLDEDAVLNLSHLNLAPDGYVLAAVRRAANKHGWERLAPLRAYIEKMEGRKIRYDILRRLRVYERWCRTITGAD